MAGKKQPLPFDLAEVLNILQNVKAVPGEVDRPNGWKAKLLDYRNQMFLWFLVGALVLLPIMVWAVLNWPAGLSAGSAGH